MAWPEPDNNQTPSTTPTSTDVGGTSMGTTTVAGDTTMTPGTSPSPEPVETEVKPEEPKIIESLESQIKETEIPTPVSSEPTGQASTDMGGGSDEYPSG